MNSMIAGTALESDGLSLEEIVLAAHRNSTTPGMNNVALFNNAAQSWNHQFYWQCMKSSGGGRPVGKLGAMIDSSFGSFDEFKKQFAAAGNTAFGSGWAWLVYDGKQLAITKTIGAGTPLVSGSTPILTMDVWEHAYYLDYQNKRDTYIDTFLDKLVNWGFVLQNLERVLAGRHAEL